MAIAFKNPVFYVVIAVLIWSTGGLFIKLTTLDAYQVTFFRSLLAAVTVMLITRKSGLKINLFGIMVSVIYALLLFLFVWATKHGTSANAIFLQYTAPIYILILAPFVIGEKFHWRDLATIVFCIGGMSLFFVGQLDTTAYQANIAALASGVFLGLYIMLLKHPAALGSKGIGESGSEGVRSRGIEEKGNREVENFESRGIEENWSPRNAGTGTSDSSTPQLPSSPTPLNPVITVIYGNLILALFTLPSGISALPTITLPDVAAVSFLGIIQIGLSYILFIKGVTGGTRPLDASIIGFIEPLLNPVWVFLFVGEKPSNWALLGGAIIIATVVVHTLIQYRVRSPHVSD